MTDRNKIKVIVAHSKWKEAKFMTLKEAIDMYVTPYGFDADEVRYDIKRNSHWLGRGNRWVLEIGVLRDDDEDEG